MNNVITRGAMATAVGAVSAIVGFWTRYSDRLTKADAKAVSAREAAEDARKDAKPAQDRVSLVALVVDGQGSPGAPQLQPRGLCCQGECGCASQTNRVLFAAKAVSHRGAVRLAGSSACIISNMRLMSMSRMRA
jgi:hypothetical protein